MRWSNGLLITYFAKSAIDKVVILLDQHLTKKISILGVSADITTLNAPMVKPTYLDLELHVEFTKELAKSNLFLPSLTYPNKHLLIDEPKSDEAVVSICCFMCS